MAVIAEFQQKSDETETTTTSAQSSETPPSANAGTSTTLTHYQDHHHPHQQQQQHRQRQGVRDERRQWLVLHDRKSRSFDSSFEDRRQQPAPPHHLAVDQRLRPPQSAGVDDEAKDEYRSRRRRLHETRGKSRSLDVYEPSPRTDGGTAPCRAAVVARLRRSSVRVTDELPERTHRVARCPDSSSIGQEQRYGNHHPLCSLCLPLCACMSPNKLRKA